MNIFYQSFLLRMWKTTSSGGSNWHASLEDPHTHKILTFYDPEVLCRFLRRTTEMSDDENELNYEATKEGKENEEK